MTGVQLLAARSEKGWTQSQACAALRVSQPYLSLMEQGLRRVPDAVVKRAARVFGLSAEALPLDVGDAPAKDFPRALGSLGYPGYAHMRGELENPASLLVAALSQPDLQGRVVEALPWLAMRSTLLDWDWLVREAKQRDVQNRLAYVAGLAMRKTSNPTVRQTLVQQLARLERARLAREDTLCSESMTQAERKWLRPRRPVEAMHWNLLTDLSVEQLPYE